MTAARTLQAALAVEHQVVYGYGLVGAQLSGPPRHAALQRLAAHQLLRDRIAALLREVGLTPVAAQPAYALPYPVEDAGAALRLAVSLEEAAAGCAWDVATAARAGGTARRLAVTTLADAATAASRWRLLVPGAADPALPGQPAHASASQPSRIPTSSPSVSTSASGTTS